MADAIVRNDEVVGSIPTSSTMFSITYSHSQTPICSILFQKIQVCREFASTNFRCSFESTCEHFEGPFPDRPVNLRGLRRWWSSRSIEYIQSTTSLASQ